MARALRPAVDSPDPELRDLARKAVLMVRNTTFKRTEELAGARGEATRAAVQYARAAATQLFSTAKTLSREATTAR